MVRARTGPDRTPIAIGFGAGGDADKAVAGAPDFFDAGVDIVVWSRRGELDPVRLDALAAVISEA